MCVQTKVCERIYSIMMTMDTTQAQKLFPTYVPFLSLSLAWYQVSLCSVVRIPTGYSAGVGAALKIWWSSFTMWVPGAAARQPPGTSYKTSSLKNLGRVEWILGRGEESKEQLRGSKETKEGLEKIRSSLLVESPLSSSLLRLLSSSPSNYSAC